METLFILICSEQTFRSLVSALHSPGKALEVGNLCCQSGKGGRGWVDSRQPKDASRGLPLLREAAKISWFKVVDKHSIKPLLMKNSGFCQGLKRLSCGGLGSRNDCLSFLPKG